VIAAAAGAVDWAIGEPLYHASRRPVRDKAERGEIPAPCLNRLIIPCSCGTGCAARAPMWLAARCGFGGRRESGADRAGKFSLADTLRRHVEALREALETPSAASQAR